VPLSSVDPAIIALAGIVLVLAGIAGV